MSRCVACDKFCIDAPLSSPPTPAQVNALPTPIRSYIHDLETRCDHSGDIRTIAALRDQVAQLEMEHLESVRWVTNPDCPGTWFKYYKGLFQGYEYFVTGSRGVLEYSRVPGVALMPSPDGYRWLGPMPLDPDAQVESGDVK
jgi:hypothetical protein